MKNVRVLIADDHRIVLDGLKNIIEPAFNLVGTVEDGRALVKAAEKLHPDVIIVDISMPLLNGIEAVQQIKKVNADVKVIFLTMHQEAAYAKRAFEAGASGYVLKHSASAELITAVSEAIQGRTYITPLIAGDLLESYRNSDKKEPGSVEKLTPRQREVMQLLAEGHSAKEIADILCISPRTVEFHKYKMMEELKITNSAELTQYAIKNGIVSI